MWDFFETIRHRHSIRKYRSELEVEQEKLHAILEVACSAPSAGDLQSYKIHVVTAAGDRDALCKAANDQDFVRQAPVCLVFCADLDRAQQEFGTRGRTLFALQDATIAASYAQLATVAAGMGSTWIGHFSGESVQRLLDLADNMVPIAMLSIGYPAETPAPSPRRPLNDVLVYP